MSSYVQVAGHSHDRESFYRDLCESMSSGVVVIDGDGSIETFNSAAAQIIDLE